MKFIKKPIVINAEQYTEYGKLVNGMCNSQSCYTSGNTNPHVHTIHNNQIVNLEIGDYVIPEPDGEHYYPCKPDIFLNTYEPISESTPVNAEPTPSKSKRDLLRESFDKSVKKLMPTWTFEGAEGENGYDWIYEAMEEYAAQFHPKPIGQEVESVVKTVKIDLLWELIQDWQDARDVEEDFNKPKFSFNDIEVEFYNKMEEIDTKSKSNQKPPTAVEVLEWITKDFDLVDGDYYYRYDHDGDKPLSATELYTLFKQHKQG